jgi:O-antigen/teichoic acid export membrane protein
LAKKEVRLQYSGFIVFAARMLSIASGLIFNLLLIRSLERPDAQYGIWSNISDLTTYFMFLAAALPFWTTRFVARGKEGAVKTGLVANSIIGLIAMALYVPLVPIITSTLGVHESYLILYFAASAQIIELYLIGTLEACLRAKQPQAVGYGLLIGEICKIALAYTLIVKFQQPLLGAMLSIIIATSIQIIYYAKLLSEELKQKIRWEYVKEWLKGSVANIYNIAGNRIAAFIFILLFVYGGEVARGNYATAAIIANIIAYSFFLSFALYPKLLAKKSLEDITTSLKMVLMFAIPMTMGVMAMPDSYLTILEPVKQSFRQAAPVLSLLAIDAFIVTMSQFFTSVLFGVEKLDEKAKIPLKQLSRSNIFKVFTLPYIHSAITLPTAFYVLTNFMFDAVEAALYVTIINMTARFAMFLVLYVIIRKAIKIDIPWKNIAKYVFASAVMATVLLIIPHPTRIYLTLIATGIGGIIYLALLMVIDKEARLLVHSILQEIKFKVEGVIT